MIDLSSAQTVSITVGETGKVWVNIDERCVVRIGCAANVLLDDPVRGQEIVYSTNGPEKQGQ